MLLLLPFYSCPFRTSRSADHTSPAGHKVYRVLSCAVSMLSCWFVCLFVCLPACLLAGLFTLHLLSPTVCVPAFPARVDAAYMLFLIKLSFGNYLHFSPPALVTHITVYLHCRNCSVFCARCSLSHLLTPFFFLSSLFQVMSQSGYVRGKSVVVGDCWMVFQMRVSSSSSANFQTFPFFLPRQMRYK